jgi:hypothetical protein
MVTLATIAQSRISGTAPKVWRTLAPPSTYAVFPVRVQATKVGSLE